MTKRNSVFAAAAVMALGACCLFLASAARTAPPVQGPRPLLASTEPAPAVQPAPPAPTAHAADPDRGLARGYFPRLQPRPATIALTGDKGGNILFLVVDALRPDHMGLYGYDKPTTPFFDQLAAESFVFLQHSTNAPWTRPSTATMLTGLLPTQHRTQTDQSKLPPSIGTIAQALAARGYQTAAIVGNGNGSSVAGLEKGFQYYVDTQTHWDKLPSAADVYQEALAWLTTQRKPKKPWFLFMFVVDPHDPYHAPPEYEQQFLPKGFTGEPRRRAHWEYKNAYPKAERDSMIAVYDAAIRYTDDQTKQLFATMQQKGLLDDTSIVVTADHGDGFGEHGYYLHAHHHYDEIIRVPLIVKTPAWRGGGHVFHTTQHIDLFPTFLQWAGAKPKRGLPGEDLGALIGKPLDPHRVATSEYEAFGIRRSAMFDQRYRVILQLPADAAEFDKHIPRRELLPSVSFDREVVHVYDRLADPLDKQNLAGGALPADAQRLVDRLRAHMTGAAKPDRSVDPKLMHPSVIDDLRSLGYVQ